MPRILMLLGAGTEQILAIRLAQAMGLRVCAVDGNPEAPGLALADRGIHADILDPREMISIAEEEGVDGVFCHAVEVPHVVARVAEALDLPGLPVDAADRATNKDARIETLSNAGVLTPKYFVIGPGEHPSNVEIDIEYPVVVKPIDRSGARGVSLVNSEVELPEAINRAKNVGRVGRVLIEEYLKGPEISTESVILDGEIMTTGFADRNYSKKTDFSPALIENGHTVPSSLPDETKQKVIEETEKAIHALGIDWGVAKGDVILTPRGPVILEMSPRTSGGRFCADMVPLATGVQILKPLLEMAVGRTASEEDLKPKWDRAAAQRFFFPDPGHLKRISGYETVRTMPGVYDVSFTPNLLIEREVPQLQSHADRVGHVIAFASSRDRAVERAETVTNELRFHVTEKT